MLLAGLVTPLGTLTSATGIGAALALSPGPAHAATVATADTTTAPPPTARVIVRFKRSASLLAGHARALAARPDSIGAVGHAGTLSSRHGLALRDGRTVAPFTQVVTATGMSSEALAARLSTDADVESAAPDQRRHAMAAPNDPLYHDNQTGGITPVSGQWYLRAPTATVASSIDIEGAWAVSNGSASVVVAVLDTGVRPDHPDLAGKLLHGYDFIALDNNGTASTSNDGDGRDGDPSDPGDWITSTENSTKGGPYFGCADPFPSADSSWHGTQTAGLIGAATNNGIGMAGVGRNVMILPVRVLGKCGGYDSDIIAAMQWAAGIHFDGISDNPTPARVVNLSLGSAGSCNTSSANNPNGFGTATNYTNAIAALALRNTAVVVSAGNDGLAVNLPANCAGAIAVAGLQHAGDKGDYSSLGPEVTISAPGGNCPSVAPSCQYPMLSTINSGVTGPTINRFSNSGDDAQGTSFAAPLVAGTIALIFSANPSLTVNQVHGLLQSSARRFPTTGGGSGSGGSSQPQCVALSATAQGHCYCNTFSCGAGMLDAGAALRAVAALGTVANFTTTPSYPNFSQVVQLDASASSIQAGQGSPTYLWELIANTNGASFTSATNAATATLKTGNSTGTVTVRLTLTVGATSHVMSQNIDVGAISTSVVTATPTKSSGGGSLASPPGLAWLAGLGLAVAALARIRRKAAH
jgi:serine protease